MRRENKLYPAGTQKVYNKYILLPYQAFMLGGSAKWKCFIQIETGMGGENSTLL